MAGMQQSGQLGLCYILILRGVSTGPEAMAGVGDQSVCRVGGMRPSDGSMIRGPLQA